MLRVMLIDDELPALKNMEYLLSDFENVQIIGMYTRGETALAAIEKDKPDAVLADIEMPGITGLDIAWEIAEKHNDIDVVFVTVYDKYAVSAFEASAVDYLLKPVRKERLKNTVAKLERIKNRGNDSDTGKRKIRVQCFGKFTIYDSGGSPLSWRTKKTEELMALFIHNRSRQMSRETIITVLWPETEVEKANTLFHTTLYNLKKALGALDRSFELKKESGGYRLYYDSISCDVDDLEKVLLSLSQACDENKTPDEIFSLYKGAYLEEDGYLWAENKRFELESKLIASCMELILYYQRNKLLEKAIIVLINIIQFDSMNQTAFEMLVGLYGRLGNTGLMLQTYEQYVRLMDELEIPPQTLEELNK